MKKSEQSFTTYFQHWLKDEFLPDKDSCAFAFEIKHTRGKDSFPFSEVKDHQIKALLAVQTSGLVYKIADDTIGYRPFDCFAMKKCQSYIVIKYNKFFVLIDVNDFIFEKNNFPRKSLTERRATDIAELVINTK